jgi:hypothetical protein
MINDCVDSSNAAFGGKRGCTAMTGQSAGQYVDDSTIAASVSFRLLESGGFFQNIPDAACRAPVAP